jgi:aminoglycoside phosphotransferase (APT) family kinase protein
MTDEAAPELVKSTRDAEATGRQLAEWLRGMLPEGAEPEVVKVTVPESNGMSSETLLFDATWLDDQGERHAYELVARVAPHDDDVPVFPTYDLELQFRVMQIVAENSEVPVPRVRWLELDPTPVGAPFFVMDRVAGRVPPDVMPYPMGSWLSEADPADQRRLQDASVAVAAGIHDIDIEIVDVTFLHLDAPGDTPLRRHVANQRLYYDWMRNGRTYPVIEEAFEWLEEHWPADEGDTVISWGDGRIGNIMFDEFLPVAVLDWEMAALGTRGIDVGWMIFLHDFFQDICRVFELPGMPDFMRKDDVVATYAEITGLSLPDLEWYEVYAALRHAIVMARVHQRSVHFGDAEEPATPDEAVMHRDLLRQMMAGTYQR